MCNPILLGVGGLIAGIGGSVVSYTGQQAQASDMRAYQQAMYEQTRVQATQSLVSQYGDLAVRQAQEARKASQEMQVIARQALEARAKAFASSLEAGVSGVSVQNLMTDYVRREGEFMQRSMTQSKEVIQQLQRQKMGLMAEAESRILGATPRPIAGPSALALGLNIAGSAMNFMAIEENFEGVFGSVSNSAPASTSRGTAMIGGFGSGYGGFYA